MKKISKSNIKNKIFLGLSLSLLATSLVGCGNSKKEPYVCYLQKEIGLYNNLECSCVDVPNTDGYKNITIKNTGDKWADLTNTYLEVSSTIILHSYDVIDKKCPFEDMVLLPGQTYTFTARIDDSKASAINNNPKSALTSYYYTSEYTKATFKDLRVKRLTDEERYQMQSISEVLIYYTLDGKFKDGDNYHLKVDFTYNGEFYSVLSKDPMYDEKAFGLHLTYYSRSTYYPEYEFDASKLEIKSVQCYTAWKRENQPIPCRSVWRQYQSKTVNLTPYFMGIGIPLVAIGGTAIFITVLNKNKAKKKAD